jgi:sulfonate transport system permease protein
MTTTASPPKDQQKQLLDTPENVSTANHKGKPDKKRGKPLILLGIVVPLIMLFLWYWSTSVTGYFTPMQLPPPQEVVWAGVDLYQRDQLFKHIIVSTQRALIGYAIGSFLGLLVGAVIGLSRLSETLFAPTVGAFRVVPGLAWVPLLALWVGIGESSKIVLIAIGAFFPVYTTVSAALRHVDAKLVELGRAFGLNRFQLFISVQLPGAVPSVLSGLRLALAQAWILLVAAELIASSVGLGFLLNDSQNNGRVDRLILTIILFALLGKVFDSIFALVQNRVLKRWA